MFSYFKDMNEGGLLEKFTINDISKTLINYISKSQMYNMKNNLKSGEVLVKNINNYLIEIVKAKHSDLKKIENLNLIKNNDINNKEYIKIIINLSSTYNLINVL